MSDKAATDPAGHRRDWNKTLALAMLMAALSIVAGELVLRLFLRPSATGYALLFGHDLPPLRVVMPSGLNPRIDDETWSRHGKPNPLGLTKGDLWGMIRTDAKAGFATKENSISKFGWWQSNNIGARSRTPTSPQVPRGKNRIFLFGASYAQGSRLPQEQTYFSVLERLHPGMEIVNMAVDGYSMGQSYLRFQSLDGKYDFATLLFVLTPDGNIWRDVNTQRYLAEGWGAYTVLPRFVIERDKLKLVPGPYEEITDIYKFDLPTLTDKVREHLRNYDPFYLPTLYESPPLLGNLVLYKIVAKTLGARRKRGLFAEFSDDADSEGMRIIRAIFRSLDKSLRSRGKRFALVLLPDAETLALARSSDSARAQNIWDERRSAFARDDIAVIDLLPALKTAPSSEIDAGYDGSHYGAKASAVIGKALASELRKIGAL